MESTEKPRLPLNITKRDGIVDFDAASLARDVSIIVAWPYAPGDNTFYVDDTLQIEAGCKILYSTEAENNPAYFRESAVRLHKSRQILANLLPGSRAHAELQAEIYTLSQHLVDYYQGRKRVKAERIVTYVDPARRLIVVDESFKYGYKPRVFGTVTRITGFVQSSVDEPGSEALDKEARKLYGQDWESEWRAGQLPHLP